MVKATANSILFPKTSQVTCIQKRYVSFCSVRKGVIYNGGEGIERSFQSDVSFQKNQEDKKIRLIKMRRGSYTNGGRGGRGREEVRGVRMRGNGVEGVL